MERVKPLELHQELRYAKTEINKFEIYIAKSENINERKKSSASLKLDIVYLTYWGNFFSTFYDFDGS